MDPSPTAEATRFTLSARMSQTADLLQAILDHESGHGSEHGAGCEGQHSGSADAKGCRSEAEGVIRNFKALSPSQIQDMLNFLRSL